MAFRLPGDHPHPRPVPLEIVPPAKQAHEAGPATRSLAALRDLAMTFAFPLAGIGLVLLIHYALGFPIGKLTRDPLAVANLSPLVGTLSSLGIVVWSVTVAVCLFGARLLRGQRSRSEEHAFFLLFGIFSAVLLVDDLFRIHDYYESYIGITEHTLYGLYLIAAAFLLVRFHRFILSAPWSLLVISLACFAASMVLDSGLVQMRHGETLGEDGAKWLGICAWCAYFCRRLYATLAPVELRSAE